MGSGDAVNEDWVWCPHPSKFAYRDIFEAEAALRRVTKSRGPRKWLHPYHCDCGWWHLGRSASGYRYWQRQSERLRAAEDRWARPIWCLPVEGVLSPLDTDDADGVALPLLYAGRRGRLPYHPEIVARIGRLHRQQVVDVRWLTGWKAKDLQAWAPLGLGPLARMPSARGRRRSWQSNAVARIMDRHIDRRCIWTDSTLTRSRLRGFDTARLFTVTPDPRVGITHADIDSIEEWTEIAWPAKAAAC